MRLTLFSNVTTVSKAISLTNNHALNNYLPSQIKNLSSLQVVRPAKKIQSLNHAIKELISRNMSSFSAEPLFEVLDMASREFNEKIKQAMIKPAGYLSRFFSNENWEEWAENRTALGKVITLLSGYLEGDISKKVFFERLDASLVSKANNEAEKLLEVIQEDTSNAENNSFENSWQEIWSAVVTIDNKVSQLFTFLPRVVAENNEAIESNGENVIKKLSKGQYQISTCLELQAMSQDLSGSYQLANDIDCTNTKNWNGGQGFSPVGTYQNFFTGNLNGQNYGVSNLYINRPSQSYVGLFGGTLSATISNLRLVNVDIIGNANIGSLIGFGGYLFSPVQSGGVISNVYATGSVSSTINGMSEAGGLIGVFVGDVTNSSFDGTVKGGGGVAGLIAYTINSNISHCYSTGNIYAAGTAVGGLLGILDGQILNSYSTAAVQSIGGYIGGLVGGSYGNISSSYATGNVLTTGNYGNTVGGLVGVNFAGSVLNSYASGSVTNLGPTQPQSVGGLVGSLYRKSVILNSYAVGFIKGINSNGLGGLVGANDAETAILNSFYDLNTTGQNDTGKGISKTTLQMRQHQTFSNWSFGDVWKIEQDCDYPKLAWQQEKFSVDFATITSPQQVNVPFTISISTRTKNFNATISFYSVRGEISPLYIRMKNSQWTGNITLFSIGKGNNLALRWFSDSGYCSSFSQSWSFDIVDQNHEIPNDATLIGTVIDDNQQPVANATVELYAGHPNKRGLRMGVAAVTDVHGHYEINQIIPAQIYVKIQKAGLQDNIQLVGTASRRVVTGDALMDAVCAEVDFASWQVPVLFVPGIMGSKSSGFIYPSLPSRSPRWDSGKLTIHDPWNHPGWGALRKLLLSKDYNYKKCDLFDVPYDWSLSIENIRDQFLRPWIDKIKRRSSKGKVDIIAHSMGGLVVRSYIQSTKYAGDIRKFAMVATPNKGSDKVYYVWEGGDPVTADKLIEADTTGFAKYFYTKTLYYLFEARSGWGSYCEFYKPLAPNVPKEETCNYKDIYNFLHAELVSAGQLMPIYENALKTWTNPPAPANITHEENTLIKALHGLNCSSNPNDCVDRNGVAYRFRPPAEAFSRDNTLVQTKLFIGNGVSTVASIYVTPHTDNYGNRYQDGVPRGEEYLAYAKGDGTVLESSVKFNEYFPQDKRLECVIRSEHKGRRVEHSNIIYEMRKHIVNFITDTGKQENDCHNQAEFSYTHFEKTVEDSLLTPTTNTSAILMISIDGRIQPNISGTANLTTEYNLKLNQADLITADITDGNYKVILKSPYFESYDLSFTYFCNDSNQTFFASEWSGLYDNSLNLFTLAVNNSDTQQPLIFDRAFATPVNLQMQNGSNAQMLLIWKDPSGEKNQDVAYYNVYWQHNYEPYLKFLANSKTTQHQTNHTWQEATENTYVVRSYLKNNRSTFFSPSAGANNNSSKVFDDRSSASMLFG